MSRHWMLAALLGLGMASSASAAKGPDDASLYERGWDWEDIGQAKAIARKAGQPLPRIVELRDAGLAWSQISEGHGFKLAEVAKEAQEQTRLARDRSQGKVKRRPVAALISAPTRQLVVPSPAPARP